MDTQIVVKKPSLEGWVIMEQTQPHQQLGLKPAKDVAPGAINSTTRALIKAGGEKLLPRDPHGEPLSWLQVRGITSRIYHLITSISPWTRHQVGQQWGGAVCETYGAEWSNNAIDGALRLYAGNPQTWVDQVAHTGVAHATQLVLTPRIVPVLKSVGIAVGGLALPGLMALTYYAYQRVAGDDLKLSDLSFQQLLHQDPDGQLYFYNNRKVTKQDLKDMVVGATIYDLSKRILTVGEDHDADTKVAEILSFYAVRREDGRITLRDGTLLCKGKKCVRERLQDHTKCNTYHVGMRRLFGNNPTNEETPFQMLRLLAEHAFRANKTQASLDHETRAKVILCEDGQYCDAATGQFVEEPHSCEVQIEEVTDEVVQNVPQ